MSMFDRNQKSSPQPSPPAHQPGPSGPRSTVSAIGAKTVINGDITGSEDLVISGKVSGQISLPEHRITIQREGTVEADIVGKTIQVEGTVNGNLFGSEAVIVRSSGRVEGNLRAPRVTLEDGANFRGSIDMKPAAKPQSNKPAPQATQQQHVKPAKAGT